MFAVEAVITTHLQEVEALLKEKREARKALKNDQVRVGLLSPD